MKNEVFEKMGPKFKNMWIKRLESGEYKQSRKTLHGSRGGHCCLGVLDLCPGVPKSHTVGSTESLTREACQAVGLDHDAMHKLIKLNDEAKYSFKEIAAWIRKNL